MRKVILLLTCVCLVANSFAISTISKPATEPSPVNATKIFLPVGNKGEKISLMELSTIKVRDFEKLTGKKMNLLDKVGFKLSQRKLRSGIRADGSLNNKKLEKAFKKGSGTSDFNIGGFALGFLLGLIGVLIAYLIDDEKKRNRVKWAWLGFLVWILIVILVVI
ncbi:MAG: hypothetical protein ABI480_19025 [Chitinophagaceae bacterium]